jgi:hypothetical protein
MCPHTTVCVRRLRERGKPSVVFPNRVEVMGMESILEHIATSRLANEGLAVPTHIMYESCIDRICPHTRTCVCMHVCVSVRGRVQYVFW